MREEGAEGRGKGKGAGGVGVISLRQGRALLAAICWRRVSTAALARLWGWVRERRSLWSTVRLSKKRAWRMESGLLEVLSSSVSDQMISPAL